MGLGLKCGGKPASYGDLLAMDAPTSCISHAEIVQLVRQAMVGDLGRDVDSECFGTARRGAELFGVVTGRKPGTEHGIAIGFQNCTDSRMASGFSVGWHEPAGDVLLFPEVVKRQQRSFGSAGVVRRLSETLHEAPATIHRIHKDILRLRRGGLDDRGSHTIVGLAIWRGILGPRGAVRARKFWANPPTDYAPRTLWSLYAACAQGVKVKAPKASLGAYAGLYALFGEEVGR